MSLALTPRGPGEPNVATERPVAPSREEVHAAAKQLLDKWNLSPDGEASRGLVNRTIAALVPKYMELSQSNPADALLLAKAALANNLYISDVEAMLVPHAGWVAD